MTPPTRTRRKAPSEQPPVVARNKRQPLPISPLTLHIAAAIRAELFRRADAGDRITRAQVAAALKLTLPTLHDRLSGRRPLTTDELAVLGEVLDVNPINWMPSE